MSNTYFFVGSDPVAYVFRSRALKRQYCQAEAETAHEATGGRGQHRSVAGKQAYVQGEVCAARS